MSSLSSICTGYINPVTKLEYPRAEVVGGTALDPIVRFHFSWQPPEVLGGLTRDGIQYRVRLMTKSGETVADDVNQDLFFERNFSGFHNITTRMNITVSAESRHSSPSPSLPTVIPFAAVLECKTIAHHQFIVPWGAITPWHCC